jgi:4-amino-4-deoxy-L-arabinose transferase-like glycosyltransferase
MGGMSVILPPRPVLAPPARTARPATSRLRRLVRGAETDAWWVRPSLLALLAATAVLYLWDLSASGWANSFYSAAVQAGTKSWKAMFFGSSDASNFITVDKSPASLWVMEVSARLFGLNSWSLLVPQAVEGIAAVALLFATVRRWFGPVAGLVAGAVLAITPIAAVMFRYNNPDALLVLLLLIATYATVRALEEAQSGWLILAGVAVGFGFLAKELQALLVVPALGGAYLLAAPTSLGRRLWQLAASAAGIVVGAGWWIAAVQLTPAADRPYIGGSQNNSLWNVVFGYNGFGRLTGNETGSVGGGAVGTSGRWGITGFLRMFNASFGGQISWLLPAALVLLVAGLIWTRRAPRVDRTRAALVLWGGSVVVTALAFSLGQGIIHPYYTVALGPGIGALIGIGGVLAWNRRHRFDGRLTLAVAVGVSAGWSFALLDRTPTWHPWLRWLVVAAGGLAALCALFGINPSVTIGRATVGALLPLALVAGLAGPMAFSVDAATTPTSGAIPAAGPTGGFGGFGGFGGAGRPPGARFGGGGGGRGGPFGTAGPGPSSAPAHGTGFSGLGLTPGGAQPVGGFAVVGRGGRFGGGGPFGGGGRFGGRPGGGGLLNGTTPSASLVKALEAGGGHYTWLIATTGSEEASGYQLATRQPVMSIGGFNGTDPAPTLAQFEADVRAGKIHWYLNDGGFGGFGGFGGGGSGNVASAIASWVTSRYPEKTIDGLTLYDLASA